MTTTKVLLAAYRKLYFKTTTTNCDLLGLLGCFWSNGKMFINKCVSHRTENLMFYSLNSINCFATIKTCDILKVKYGRECECVIVNKATILHPFYNSKTKANK